MAALSQFKDDATGLLLLEQLHLRPELRAVLAGGGQALQVGLHRLQRPLRVGHLRGDGLLGRGGGPLGLEELPRDDVLRRREGGNNNNNNNHNNNNNIIIY